MSAPVFKDFDKTTTDLLNDDFDSKYSLKIKSVGPCNAVLTTNTTFDEKEKKLEAKISAKYAHSSGFTVEKLEISPKGKVATETSLVNAAPGLKLEFKGNDTDKGDLSFTYSPTPLATITGEVDALNFAKANASVSIAHGAIVGGGCVDATFAKQGLESTKFGLGLGYSIPKLFAGFRANNSLADFSGTISYDVSDDLSVIGKACHSTAGKTAGTKSTLAGIYRYGPSTTIKVKAANSGIINASVKQQFEKKFSVVGSVEIPSGFTTGYKFGVNATLG